MSAAADRARVVAVSRAQMREVDRIMVDDLGIELVQMMENAGRGCAQRARAMLGGDVTGCRVGVLAGTGGNGGGGLAAGRRLAVWGAEVTVTLARPAASMTGVPARQLAVLERMGVAVHEPGEPLPEAELLIDALVGYSLRGTPRPPVDSLIRSANAAAAPVLALDVPSGLDADRGTPGEPCIRATETLTLALPKSGLMDPAAEPFVGDLYLADISVPTSVYHRLGLPVGAIFQRDDVVAVRVGAHAR